MKIPPSYVLTSEMIDLIVQIDSYRHFFTAFPLSPFVKEKLIRVSLLKSAVFSARIEGNDLTVETVMAASDQKKKKEIFNIADAVRYIEKRVAPEEKITREHILSLHQLVMRDLRTDAGFFRKEMSAIFNQAGIVVYLAPPPTQINGLISRLLAYINSPEEQFPLIHAFIAHLLFEKIHPFIDGNGRVGRLLISVVLRRRAYQFGLFIPFEEYLDERKNDYYSYLDSGLKDTNNYLLFMLSGFLAQLEKMKTDVINEMSKGQDVLLLTPRQEEIYHIIREHRIVSLDFIRRRFLAVPARTLRYEVKKLVEKGYIVKVGKTKGSFYRLHSSPFPTIQNLT